MEISDETLRPSFIIPVPAWRLSAGSNLRCFHAVASRRLVVMPYSRLFSRHLERVACCAILHPTHRALSTSPLLQAFTAAAAGVAIYVMSRTFCRQTASVLANVLCSTAHTRPALQHPFRLKPRIQNVLDFLALHARHVARYAIRTTHVMTFTSKWIVQILLLHGLILLVTRIFRSVA